MIIISVFFIGRSRLDGLGYAGIFWNKPGRIDVEATAVR
jgi:hypothetical protein